MAIEQMICFVTPDAPAQVPRSVTRRIDDMCRRIGRIHFATLALLPPRPGASVLAAPSLMMEIVVDEDLLLPDLVDLMIERAFGVLWRLYKVSWNGPAGADPGTKRTWLRAFLIAHASVADGGFVGARDRSVAQVQAEQALFEGARAQVQGLPRAQRPADPRSLAEHVVAWAQAHGFGWIATPAPRSRWRKGPDFGFDDWAALLASMVVPLLAVLGFLYTLGWAAIFSAWLMGALELPIACNRLVGSVMTCNASAAAIAAAVTVLLALLPVVLAMLSGGGIVALAFLTTGYALVTLGVTLYGVYDAVAHINLVWPTCSMNIGVLGLFTALGFGTAVAWLALFPLLASLRAPSFFPILLTLSGLVLLGFVGWMLAQLMFSELRVLSMQCGHGQWRPVDAISPRTRVGMTLLACTLVVGVAAFILVFATRWAPRMLKVARQWDRPKPLPPLPAHQVHPSIQKCEADLSRRTSHMISLTEIRRPYWLWSACLWFWLKFFSWLGNTVFTEGVLGNAHGIKFGHWHIIDRGRRLLFCSNFDSAFGGYLDEFIQGATEGVNLIWRTTELLPREAARWDHPKVEMARSFPPTFLGIYRGCKAEQVFKAYTRASMLPHLHRFEAYCLSNQDIERATRLRDALRGTRTEVKDDLIARALES